MVGLIYLLTVAGSAIWVGIDASSLRRQRGGRTIDGIANTSTAAWVLVVLCLWIIGLPIYLCVRPQLVREARAGTWPTAISAYAPPTQWRGPAAPPGQVYGGVPAYGVTTAAQPAPTVTAPQAPTVTAPQAPTVTAPPAPASQPEVPAGAPVSPDGFWWWDGASWRPTVHRPTS